MALPLALLLCAHAVSATQPIIGTLHEEPETALLLATAVEAALNVEHPLSPASLEPGEPLSVLRAVCDLVKQGANGAVFGGGGAPLAAAVAARAGLPLLLVEPAAHRPTWPALCLYPHPDVIAQAGRALVVEKGWTRTVLLHEGSPPASALQLLELNDARLSVAMTARRLPSPRDHALLRNLLLVLKKSGATNFIVWCSHECIVRVLGEAQRVGLLADRHSYLLLDLELHTAPLANFSHGGANITGLQLFDPESKAVTEARASWRRLTGEEATSTAQVLAYDGATLMAAAWRELDLPQVPSGDCAAGRAGLHAETLVNHMRTMPVDSGALSGQMLLDGQGARREVRLEVVELERGGRLKRVAWWQYGRLKWQRGAEETPADATDSMTNKTFNVLIAINEPYVMLRQSKDHLSGNNRYEGFCIELIEKLAELLHFNYTFVLQHDNKYGSLDTGAWDGMIARLINDPEMHFAITDLTITSERESAVDFTTPFMNLGISILYKRPALPEPETFAFLLPFSSGVWLCLGLAYVGTSLVLYVVGRLCPEEWQNPYPCVDEPAALENQFSLANAFWFNLAAVLLQGSEIAPVAYGTRAVASVWWLFALVITSSYTANLATLLAMKTTTEVIHNVEELANSPDITYGAKYKGSTYNFFKDNKNDSLYLKMYEHMSQHEMPRNNTDGIAKVTQENYAFLMESTTIEHVTQRNCKVKQIGNLLDSKGYGIAMNKNNTAYLQAMNLALLYLMERGVLREMKHSWWNEKHGGGSCNSDDNEVGSEKLTMKNFLGLFLVLVVGSVLGVLLSFIDLVYHTSVRARLRQVRFRDQLWAELRFVSRFGRSEKPLALSLSPSPEESSARRTDSARSMRSSRRRSTQHTIHEASVRLARHSRRPS